jgi:hypothetical protein
MLILISSCLFAASRGSLLTHPFIGSAATSEAGSQGAGASGTDPSSIPITNRTCKILTLNISYETARQNPLEKEPKSGEVKQPKLRYIF